MQNNNRRNPFGSVLPISIREVIPSTMNHRKKEEASSKDDGDTHYHRAIRAVLHHKHLAALANGNKAMRDYHEDMVQKLRADLPKVLARHRITSAQIRDAREQRVPMKNMQWHLSQLEEDRRKDMGNGR